MSNTAHNTHADAAPHPVRAAHSGTFLGVGPASQSQNDSNLPAQKSRVRLMPGALIPGTNYRIKRWLGEGSMGVVFEAENVQIGRRVALKVLADRLGENAEAISAFREEARASATIGNPNIVDVYDFFTLEDGRSVTAMEFLEGKTLQDLAEAGPMEPGRLIGIFRQVCKALEAAHEAGLVHRDIKPDNIMLVEREGRPDTVKVVDFGLASAVGSTTQRAAVGTPRHMSPEAVLNLPIDGRTDLYSLGSTMYTLATGVAPFSDRTELQAILRAHVSDLPRPPRQLNPAIPPALEAVILKCLEKKPNQRFPDAKAVEAALCEAQIAAKLQTSWDDLPIPDVDPAQRERIIAGMPEARVRNRGRSRWLVYGLLGGGLAASAMFLALRKPVQTKTQVVERVVEVQTPEQITAVELVAERAEDAAARALFVYPPVDEPERETAYQAIRALEALDEPGAESKASELRTQFADTLQRLGDEYWARPGGIPFALDFYIQALLFDDALHRSQQRAGISPGQLAALRLKALDGSFTTEELIAVEPLTALAEPDEPTRKKKLDKIRRKRKRKRPASVEASLEAIADPEAAQVLAAQDAAEAEVDADETGGAETDETGDAGETGAGELDAATPDDEAPDGAAAAARHTATADELLAQGKKSQAEAAYHRALKADSRHYDALVGLGRLYFSQAKYGQSAKYRRMAVKKKPKDGALRIDLGDSYFKNAEYAAAQKQYERANELGEAQAAGRLAKVAAKTGG